MMEATIQTKKHGILITDEPRYGLPLILEYVNYIPRTPEFENFSYLEITGVDEFNFSEWFLKEKCKDQDPCNALLDYGIDSGRERWRNYSNTEYVSYLFRHARNCLRSIVNAAKMFDKPKLYWYYIEKEFVIDYKTDAISKVVLIEKAPFYVSIKAQYSDDYNYRILVRPCVSEDDLEDARELYGNLARDGAKLSEDCVLNKCPSYYYLVMDDCEMFVGNIINKNICERTSKIKTLIGE